MKTTDRWPLIAGWLGIALIIVGGIAVEIEGYPGSGASLSEYAASSADDTYKAVNALNWLLTTLGGILILALITTVHSRLRAGGVSASGATLHYVFGLFFVLLLLAHAAVDEGYTGSSYFDAFEFNEQTAPIGIALNEVRFALEVQSVLLGAAMIFTGSWLFARLENVPSWLTRGGYPLGVLLLVIAVPLETLGLLFVLLWLAVAGSAVILTESAEAPGALQT
jgi:hypothetical protein